MKEDKAYIIRKVLTVICLVLVFATAGLLAITTQLKTITFDYYGNVKSIKTLASSVEGFLLQNKIYISDEAIVEPARDSRVKNGMTLTISSDTNKAFDIESIRESYAPIVASVRQEVESIPFGEERVNNADVEIGTNSVIQEGVEGQKAISYIVKTSKDKVIQKDEIGTEVLAEARNRVVEVGTKVSRSGLIRSIMASPVDGGFVHYNVSLAPEYQQYAYNLCVRFGVSYPLFLALMYVESGYNPRATNSSGPYIGLCQVAQSHMPELRQTLGINDLYDPYDNMAAGAYYLSYYIRNNGGLEAGLASYGGGASYVDLILSRTEQLINNGGL